jgi:hypothetical protein
VCARAKRQRQGETDIGQDENASRAGTPGNPGLRRKKMGQQCPMNMLTEEPTHKQTTKEEE